MIYCIYLRDEVRFRVISRGCNLPEAVPTVGKVGLNK
jgi:hypothetical protein